MILINKLRLQLVLLISISNFGNCADQTRPASPLANCLKSNGDPRKHDEIDEACISALNNTEHAEQGKIDEVLIKAIENKNDRAVKIIIEKYQPSLAKINKGLEKAASYENSIGRDLARLDDKLEKAQGLEKSVLDTKIARAEKDRKSANKICTILINNEVTPPSEDSLRKAEEAECGRKISATSNAPTG
jgi:hypothetical protein